MLRKVGGIQIFPNASTFTELADVDQFHDRMIHTSEIF